MKKSHIMRTVCAVGVSAVCALGLASCAGGADGSNGSSTGGVAGTVNGTEIPEDTITNYIESARASMGATDTDTWGQWLVDNEYTPESLREEIINSFAQRELIKSGAEERGVKVDEAEVQGYIDQTKANYEDDEKWQAALDQSGMTEDDYRAEIELQLQAKYLKESFASDEDASEADMLQYGQMYASAYDGAKRSSHILFAAEDGTTAQEVLDKINSGELDFVDAVKQYSKDTVSAEKDGDVGWDAMSSLDEDYVAGLDPLEKDQVSGLVTSQFGIHIIKCTDVFNAPKTTGEDGTEKVEITSVDQIPADWQETIKENLKTQKRNEAYQAWLDEYTESADIVINDMPEGLPYYVDASKYTKSTTDEGTTDGTTDGATDGATEGEAEGATDGAAEGEASGDAAPAEGSAEGDGAAEGGENTDAGQQQPAEAA